MDEVLLETVNLSKSYGKEAALRNVNIALRGGRVTGLLGPNGSGKTTLLKLFNGLLHPTSGEVRIAGNAPGAAAKALVSYLPDRFALDPWMRARDALGFYAAFFDDFDREKAEASLLNLKVDLNKRIKALSKGNQEKLTLILAMSRNAKIFLLDEPIGGVDPAMRDHIMSTILNHSNKDAALLISTHLIQDVENALDDIIFLKEGEVILQGAACDIRKERGQDIDALFREMFKC